MTDSQDSPADLIRPTVITASSDNRSAEFVAPEPLEPRISTSIVEFTDSPTSTSETVNTEPLDKPIGFQEPVSNLVESNCGSVLTKDNSSEVPSIPSQSPTTANQKSNDQVVQRETWVPPPQKQEQDRAILICKLASISTDSTDLKPEMKSYKRFLEECGYEVTENYVNIEQTDTAATSYTTKLGLREAGKICKSLIAFVVQKSPVGPAVDEIMNCFRQCDDSTDKLLVICEIKEKQEDKDDVASRPPDSVREAWDDLSKIRNLIVIRSVVATRILAAEFVKLLRDRKDKHWDSKGLKSIKSGAWEIGYDDITKYALKMHVDDGMTSEFKRSVSQLLKDDPNFKKIIGNGMQFESLDEGVLKTLAEDLVENRTLVYKVNQCDPKVKCKALIINNVNFTELTLERKGSDIDYENLRHVLTLMQYEVIHKRNLTAAQILEEVTRFAEETVHGDACILVIMTHGELDYLYGTDYKNISSGAVKEQELLQFMRQGDKVKGKPRLCLIQACRPKPKVETNFIVGTATEVADTKVADEVWEFFHRGVNVSRTRNIEPRDQCGLIVGYSTSAGELSNRSRTKGSRFIISVCVTFYKFAHKEDMAAMTTRISNIMTHGFEKPINGINLKTGEMQLPAWEIQADKKFFLVDTTALFDNKLDHLLKETSDCSELVEDVKKLKVSDPVT